MLRLIAILFVVLLVSGCAGTCKIVSENQSLRQLVAEEFVAGEMIVKFRPSAQLETSGVPGSVGGFSLIRAIAPGLAVYRVPNQSGVDKSVTSSAAVLAIKASPLVDYAHPNYVIRAQAAPNDTCWQENRLWSFQDTAAGIELPKARVRGLGSRDVVISVVDTGLADNYDSNAANVLPGYNAFTNTSDITDRGTFHGTHVAGTIGLLKTNNDDGSASINEASSILPVRVLDDIGSGSLASILAGIYWSVGQQIPGAPTNNRPAKIINMSLGGFFKCTDAPAFQDAINYARSRGAVIVVAAGNSALDASNFSPASCSNVVPVAASGPEGALSFYSNYGSRVRVLAPGGDNYDNDDSRSILSSVRGGFAYYQGTSMAAPHVAGVLGLLAARFPTYSHDQLTQKLLGGLRPLRAGQCSRPCGDGLLTADIP